MLLARRIGTRWPLVVAIAAAGERLARRQCLGKLGLERRQTRGRQRPRYGFYVDHIIDLSAPCSCLAGLPSQTT